MANEAIKETVNAQVAQEETPAATVEQQNAAPAAAETPEAPANNKPEEEKKKEHPKWDAFKAKAKKVGKWVGAGAALVGGLVIANKLGKAQGQAQGFDAACEAFNKGTASPLPELPELPVEEIPAVDMTVADATCDTDLLQNP